MPQPAIDYDALAAQHGGSTATPVDYDAIAIQNGAAKTEPKPSRWQTIYRNAPAVAARSVLDTLPGVGAIGGAILGGGPEDVPAMALGAGAGRGLRDLIAEKIGLDPPTTPAGKAGRIALDTALTAATPAVLSAAKSVFLHPLDSTADFIETYAHPQKTLGAVIDWLRAPKAQGPLLTKPSTVTLPNTGPIAPVGTIAPKGSSLSDSLRSVLEDLRTSPSEPVETTESAPPATQTSAGKPSVTLQGYDQLQTGTAEANAKETARYASSVRLQQAMAKTMIGDIYEQATAGKGVSDWESKFITSIDAQLKRGQTLTGPQFDVVKRIYTTLQK